MMKKIVDHTFVLCAYKESEYLEECIQSLENQTVKSNILIVTSTPNSYITTVAKKHKLKVIENTKKKKSLGIDFDFAIESAKTKYMTICHQDDTYQPTYLEEVSKTFDQNPIITFTNYNELRNGIVVSNNQLLKVKRLMLSPLKIKAFAPSIWIRRRILSLGCPICCPSVTFNKSIVKTPLFESNYRSDVDWQAWEKLSKCKGKFCYIATPLMNHRVHEESETSNVINGENGRTQEDFELFNKFWPKPIAKFITKFYAKSQKSNQL